MGSSFTSCILFDLFVNKNAVVPIQIVSSEVNCVLKCRESKSLFSYFSFYQTYLRDCSDKEFLVSVPIKE